MANKIQEINLYDAVKAMRKLSAQDIPFSFGFISCNTSQGSSKGYVEVEKSLLSAGLPQDKSIYANNLIAYEDLETGKKKHFWLPLLMKFNGLKITHDRFSRR